MPVYRIYADNIVIAEDDFEEWDNAQPYHDDYSTLKVPEGDEDAEYWGIPKVLLDYIIENRNT